MVDDITKLRVTQGRGQLSRTTGSPTHSTCMTWRPNAGSSTIHTTPVKCTYSGCGYVKSSKLSSYPNQKVGYSTLLDRQGLENAPILWPMRPETIFICWPTSQILKTPWPTRLGEYTHSTPDEARNYLHILTNKLDTQISLTDKAWRIHPFHNRWGRKLPSYPDQQVGYSTLLDRQGLENTPIPRPTRPEIIFVSWPMRQIF
jgi:hypothetical protein